MDIDFEGATVVALELDFSLRIDLGPAGLVQIEVPVDFESLEGSRRVPVGDDDLTANTVFDGLVGRAVADANATPDGTLTLTFEHGARLVAAVDPGYESWMVRTPGGAIFFAGPDAQTTALPKSGSLLWSDRENNASS